MQLYCLKGLSGFLMTVQTSYDRSLPLCLTNLFLGTTVTLPQCCGGLECQMQIAPWPEDFSGLTPAVHC